MIKAVFGLAFLGLSFLLSPSAHAQSANPEDLALCRYFRNPVLCRCSLENGGEIRPSPWGRGYVLYGDFGSRSGHVDGQARCAYRAEQQGARLIGRQHPANLPDSRTKQAALNTHPPAIRLEDIPRLQQGGPAPARQAARPHQAPPQPQGGLVANARPGSVVIGPYRRLPQVIYVQYDGPGGVVSVPYVRNAQ